MPFKRRYVGMIYLYHGTDTEIISADLFYPTVG